MYRYRKRRKALKGDVSAIQSSIAPFLLGNSWFPYKKFSNPLPTKTSSSITTPNCSVIRRVSWSSALLRVHTNGDLRQVGLGGIHVIAWEPNRTVGSDGTSSVRFDERPASFFSLWIAYSMIVQSIRASTTPHVCPPFYPKVSDLSSCNVQYFWRTALARK